MNEKKRERLRSWIHEAAAEFIGHTAAIPGGLITVIRVELNEKIEHATVYVTVWPESREAEAMKAIRAARRHFYTYAKRTFTMGQRIAVDFKIDEGEKKRRRIDQLLEEEKQ